MASIYTAVNTLNTQDYRRRKSLQGLCIEGGCWERAVTLYCQKDRERYAARTRARRSTRRGG